MQNKPHVGSSTDRSGYELASQFEVNRHAEGPVRSSRRQGWCTVNVPDHDAAESDLLTTTLAIYRESLPNDRSMFNALIVD